MGKNSKIFTKSFYKIKHIQPNDDLLSHINYIIFQATQEFRKTVENTLGVKAHPQSITAVLQPNVKMKIKIGFHPKDDFSRTSVILIR